MVLLRMSSNHDPGTPASECLSVKEHAGILQERKLLDIPKLMDISAIYGHDNPDLTRRLVSNVFKGQPTYAGDLAAYIPLLLERIITMHQRCCTAIDAITNWTDLGTVEIEQSSIQEEFVEVVGFLNDTVITLKAFVEAYPPAAKILVSLEKPSSGLVLFLPALATVHDTFVPFLQESFAVLSSSAGGHIHDTTKMHDREKVVVAAQDKLHKLGGKLVDLSWLLIEFRYLNEVWGEDLGVSGRTRKADEDALWKGDSLVQLIVTLAVGPPEKYDKTTGEFGSGGTRLICTGAFLRSIEKRHGLYNQICQAHERGAIFLDNAQQVDLSALMASNKSSNGVKENPLILSTESFPELTLPDKEAEEETVIQQSKISQIKDLFPEYGDGFIAACLEAYDNDPEKVIERVLEGTLHSDLLSLDMSLKAKPNKIASVVKDKGKGKINEQPVSNKGKSIWEKSSVKESGSSSSLAGGSGAAGEYSEGSLPLESINNSVTVGRYVRRQKESGTFNELLDSRSGNKELHAAIKAAAAQIEYEDEYDDSFDELGLGYVADPGGNEETENLADEVGRRGGTRDENAYMSNNNRPIILTPWGTSTTKGRGYSAGVPRASFQPQRSSTVGLEVEGQVGDTPDDSTAGQGRGGRGGRGRKKWKEQGPKPQFYLKEGKLYSYKVAGAVGVASVEEAEAIKQEETETLYGLGEGGNVPVQQRDTSAYQRKEDSNEDNSKLRQAGVSGEVGKQHPGMSGEGGRGRGANSRGRGVPGRGSWTRKDSANHNRKEGAMKKHFGGL